MILKFNFIVSVFGSFYQFIIYIKLINLQSFKVMKIKNNAIMHNSQRILFLLFLVLVVFTIYFFKNTIFKSTFLLKSYGEVTMEPEIAFSNKKPSYLEFYAEWCEVCKEMAPSIDRLKNEFENDINFIFINVDSPKSEKFVKEFEVNGIPQINLFDSSANLGARFVGLQDESELKQALENLVIIKKNKKIQVSSKDPLIEHNKEI